MIARLMGLPTITPRELHRLIQEGRALAIDVNAPSSWVQARVPGAVNLDPESYDPADLPTNRAALLVFYCSNPLCSKAPRAARRARRLGHEHARGTSADLPLDRRLRDGLAGGVLVAVP